MTQIAHRPPAPRRGGSRRGGSCPRSRAAGAPGTTWLPVAITPPPALLRLPGQELRRTIARVEHHSAAIRPASAGFAASDAPMTCELIRPPGSNRRSPIPRLSGDLDVDLHRCGRLRFLSDPGLLSRFGPAGGQLPRCGRMGTCLSRALSRMSGNGAARPEPAQAETMRADL